MAQVSSGSFTTTASEGRSLTFNWSVNSTSISGNYKDIYWSLTGSGSAGGYVMAGNFTVVIDGETVYSSATRIQLWSGTVVASGTKRIYHGTTGNKTFSASASAGIYAVAVNCSGSGSWELPTIPRYFTKTPILTLSSKNETSMIFNWSTSETASGVCYDIYNSSDTLIFSSASTSINSTSGNITVTGLSPNTTYKVRVRATRKDSGLESASDKNTQATYNYPHITKVGVTDLVIGNSQTLTLYNPLGRTVTVKMNKDTAGGTQLYSGTTKTTSINFAPAGSILYATIPNSTSGKAVYTCIYSNLHTQSTSGAYTYKIKGTEVPTFTTFTYKDSNTAVTGVTGNDQVLVKGLSTLQVTIPSANKMVANNSATAKNYTISIDNLSDTKNYATTDVVSSLGVINSSGTKRINVKAYDSRNLFTLAYKDITVYDYAKPVINASITRLNNFEAETTIKVNGTFTTLNVGGTNKNSITAVQYRYRETGGTWSNYVTLTTTISNNKFTCNDVVISLDNTKSFEFEIKAIDKLDYNTGTVKVDVGEAIFFISTNKKACYINGEVIKLGYREPARLVDGDYNTMCGNESGFYRSTSVTNAPYTQAGQNASSNWFYITQIAHSLTYLLQIASPFFDTGLYYRSCKAGTWTNWVKVSDNQNLIAQILANTQDKPATAGTEQLYKIATKTISRGSDDIITVNTSTGKATVNKDVGLVRIILNTQVYSTGSATYLTIRGYKNNTQFGNMRFKPQTGYETRASSFFYTTLSKGDILDIRIVSDSTTLTMQNASIIIEQL